MFDDPQKSLAEELHQSNLTTPSDGIEFAVRGMIYAQRGMEAEAEADFRASLRIEPRAETHLALASTLAMLHRPLEALAETEAALRLQPNCDTLLLRAGLLHVLHRHDEALETLRQAVALDPQYADAHLALGQALYDFKQYDESLLETNEADGLQADNPETLVLRARIYHKLGRLEDALDDLDRAIELDPGDAHAYRQRSRAHRESAQLSRNRGNEMEAQLHDEMAEQDRQSAKMIERGSSA